MEIARNISLVWLNCLTLIAVLPFGIIFFLAVLGMRRLRQLVKQYLPIAQEKAESLADATDRVSGKVAAPVVGLHARGAQIQGALHAIRRRRE